MSSDTKEQVFSVTNGRGKYYLHTKEVELRNHHRQTIYYFASKIQEGAIFEIPDGFEVVENASATLPCLRRKK